MDSLCNILQLRKAVTSLPTSFIGIGQFSTLHSAETTEPILVKLENFKRPPEDRRPWQMIFRSDDVGGLGE